MKRLLPFLAAILFVFTARAASPVTVTLVNVYPGSDIYELEGHSALRLTSADGDFAVSWGQFDFNAPNFVYRFVKGETDYSVALIPWVYFENAYLRQGRRMVGHVIDMDSTQTAALLEFVARNLQPANRIYRYNYVKDNCATRPLRALEAAFGDSIALGPAVVESESSFPVTFRNVMRRYHANYPWYQFGIDLALGSGIDYPLSRREMAFAPVVMDSQLASATVGGHLLVKSVRVLADFPPDNAVLPPTPWYLSPMFVCWLVFALILAVCIADVGRGCTSRAVQAVYFGIEGLAGCLLTFLIFVSVHEATSPNWLYVWLNPLCLIPTIFIWLNKCKPLVLSWQFANFVLLFTMCVLWPWLPQSANPAFLPLVLASMVLSASYIKVNYPNGKNTTRK